MIQKNDFIELDYTGRLTEDNEVFDTTKESIAKEKGIYNENNPKTFVPLIICVGQGQVVKGLDDALIGKKEGDEFKVTVTPETGFGKKKSELLNLMSLNTFKKQDIKPFPGLQVNIDEQFGIVKTVSGGRVIVDFNHPLSGQTLIYEVKILKKIDDVKKKIELTLNSLFQLKGNITYDKETNKAEIKLELPQIADVDGISNLENLLKEKIKEITGVEIELKK